MELDLPELHAHALESTRRFVAGVRADQWDLASPCEDWSVRELVNHIVTGNYWAGALGRGRTIEEVGDRLDGDVLGDDPLAEYEASAGDADAAFRAPGAMDAPCAVSYGPVPGRVYCGHRLLDVLVHGWDVGTGTGQDTTLDGELVEACWVIVEAERDMVTASGMYGTEQEVGPDADRQTALLAVLGRRA